MPLRFRIYYDDGTTYSGDPFYAPQTGVQCVATEDPNAEAGYKVKAVRDAFYWDGRQWRACDEAGMWDHLLMYQGPKAIIFGRWMKRDDDFWSILAQANREGLGGE